MKNDLSNRLLKTIYTVSIFLLVFIAPLTLFAQSNSTAEVMLSVLWEHSFYQTGLRVYADGRYRLEKVDGLPNGSSAQIYEGLLTDQSMKELTDIIHQGDFEALQGKLPRSGLMILGKYGQLVIVESRQLIQIQKFSLADPNGTTALPSAIKPLLKWISELKPEKSSRIKKAKPVLCLPVR